MTSTNKIAELAMGRIFGMMLRPHREGDEAEYERCRAIILNNVEAPEYRDMAHDFGRDYRSILMSGQAS